jgi:hypothetical protein
MTQSVLRKKGGKVGGPSFDGRLADAQKLGGFLSFYGFRVQGNHPIRKCCLLIRGRQTAPCAADKEMPIR